VQTHFHSAQATKNLLKKSTTLRLIVEIILKIIPLKALLQNQRCQMQRITKTAMARFMVIGNLIHVMLQVVKFKVL